MVGTQFVLWVAMFGVMPSWSTELFKVVHEKREKGDIVFRLPLVDRSRPNVEITDFMISQRIDNDPPRYNHEWYDHVFVLSSNPGDWGFSVDSYRQLRDYVESEENYMVPEVIEQDRSRASVSSRLARGSSAHILTKRSPPSANTSTKKKVARMIKDPRTTYVFIEKYSIVVQAEIVAGYDPDLWLDGHLLLKPLVQYYYVPNGVHACDPMSVGKDVGVDGRRPCVVEELIKPFKKDGLSRTGRALSGKGWHILDETRFHKNVALPFNDDPPPYDPSLYDPPPSYSSVTRRSSSVRSRIPSLVDDASLPTSYTQEDDIEKLLNTALFLQNKVGVYKPTHML